MKHSKYSLKKRGYRIVSRFPEGLSFKDAKAQHAETGEPGEVFEMADGPPALATKEG